MKVGLIQFPPALADVGETIRRLDPLIRRCEGSQIVVLPELCNSGYNFPSTEVARKASEEIGRSEFLRFLETRCKDLGFHVVTGFCEREGESLFNSAVLVGPGGVLGRYRKLHLFLNEKDHFLPGSGGLTVYDLGFCRVGMLVCYDWHFPEVWRILALQGADCICHPSNLVLPGLAQRAVPIHALLNRVFVFTCNRVGSEGDLRFTGLSVISNPKGEVLAQGSKEGSEVIFAEIDPGMARDKNLTSRNHLFLDRRPGEYRGLAERENIEYRTPNIES